MRHVKLPTASGRAFSSALIVLAALLAFIPATLSAAENKVFALCYHSFLGNKFPSDIPLEEFSSQMAFLKSRGFGFVSYADLVNGTVSGTRNILVVIDDGNHSVLRAYREVMKPMGIRPLLAVYPNIIGRKSYALTWEQLDGLRKGGCDIAAHGYYHELMNREFYERDPRQFVREIARSKETLEEKLPGLKVSAFVYPNGVRADITKKVLREEGYACAFTINWGATVSPLARNRDVLELPRYMVMKGNWNMISSAILKASAG